MVDKKKGVILSFITMICWALHDVSFRYAAVEFRVEPTVFICFTLFVSAFVLILIAGPGMRGIATLRRGHTWAYGILEVFLNIAQMFALLYITTTEMNFLNRFTVIMSLISTWIIFNRKPHASDLIGAGLVATGLYFIAAGLDDAIRIQALVCIFFVAFTSVSTAMLGEVHPENVEADTVRDRSRVAGYVLLACSFIFLVISLGVAFLKANATEVAAALPIVSGMPDLADFGHKPTFVMALGLGLTIMPLAMYYFFYATKVAKTETFMAVSSTLPFVTYIVESGAAKLGLLSVSAITGKDLAAGGLIVLGAFLIEYMRHRNLKKKARNNTSTVKKDDYDMVCTALRFCENNLIIAAEKLGVSVKELEKVHEGQGFVSFDVSGNRYHSILRNYHRNIATVDPLTNLANRDALASAVDEALNKKVPFSIVFMDLNKFKPINDTYGHEAGDLVLKTVSKRLRQGLPADSVICRLGGDEFVVMLIDANRYDAEKLADEIYEIVEDPIDLEDGTEVTVGTSLGLAVAYEDGKTLKQLLDVADKNMYAEKEESDR